MTDDPASVADAIRLTPEDNVATALRAIAAGEQVAVRCGTRTTTVKAAQAIPLCHKLSVTAIAVGALIVKYGDPIGAASAAIAPGEHVHIHNLRSRRARAKPA